MKKTVQDYLPSRIWLMKTEPAVFSFDDLEKRPGQKEKWDGVRNYQARNFMRDEMQVDDVVLFYHSSCDPAGVVGEARVVAAAAPDLTALDKKSEYYDEKATQDDVRWVAVTVGAPKRYPSFVSLAALRAQKELTGMLLLRPGQRLSIQPVSQEELAVIRKLGEGLPGRAEVCAKENIIF